MEILSFVDYPADLWVAPRWRPVTVGCCGVAGSDMSVVDTCLAKLHSVLAERGVAVSARSPADSGGSDSEEAGAAAARRVCSFCERRERAPGAFELCSLCVADGRAEPRAYCGKACQTDDWELGHWEEHN